MITTCEGKPGEGKTCNPTGQISSNRTQAEMMTEALLYSPLVTMIESRFRATDRNLTIRLRNHVRTQR